MKQQNWWQLLCIQAGGAICLPVIMVGQILAQQYGFLVALAMIAVGNALLLSYALVSGKMGMATGHSTIELVIDRFGKYGTHLFGAIFLVSMVGWFAIQINVVTESISHVLALIFPDIAIPAIVLNVFLGLLMTAVSAYGIRGLSILSQLSLPLLVGTLGFAMYSVAGGGTVMPHLFSFTGISLVVATAIGGAIDLPTYWRHARSHKEGTLATILLFGLALPAIELVGVYLGVHAPEASLLAMFTQGGGFLWNLWVAFFLFIAGWATNNTNLYSAGVNSFALMPGWNFTQRTLCIGAVGTLLACMGLLQHFTLALEGMGILIASMGSVMMVSYLQKSGHAVKNYASCAIGFIFGLTSLTDIFPLTGAPVVDAFLSAAGATLLLTLGSRKGHEVLKN